MRWLLAALVACACPQKAPPVPAQVDNKPGPLPTCESVRGKVEQLYRAEAQQKEPKRVDEATADNTAMVMHHCTTGMATCLDHAQTVMDVEHCLPPLDEEGTEGEHS